MKRRRGTEKDTGGNRGPAVDGLPVPFGAGEALACGPTSSTAQAGGTAGHVPAARRAWPRRATVTSRSSPITGDAGECWPCPGSLHVGLLENQSPSSSRGIGDLHLHTRGSAIPGGVMTPGGTWTVGGREVGSAYSADGTHLNGATYGGPGDPLRQRPGRRRRVVPAPERRAQGEPSLGYTPWS